MGDLRAWETLVEASKQTTILHDAKFIQVMEDVYHCSAVPLVIKIDGQMAGVSAFRVSNLFSGHKLTSMPFNFYPTLVGFQDDEKAFSHLISAAEKMPGEAYVEYKTFSEMSLQERRGENPGADA